MFLDVHGENVTDFGMQWNGLLCAVVRVYVEVMPRTRTGKLSTRLYRKPPVSFIAWFDYFKFRLGLCYECFAEGFE